jgi:hypothetical protein
MNWGSTQLWFCTAVLSAATWLAGTGRLSGESWMAVAVIALGAFGIRKTMEHRNDGNGKPPVPPQP